MGQRIQPPRVVKKQGLRLPHMAAIATMVLGVAGLSAHFAVSQDGSRPLTRTARQPAKLQPVPVAPVVEGEDALIDLASLSRTEVIGATAYEAHTQCYEGNPFPSAKTCGKCHPKHFREWSVSPHAYAQLSPVFNSFQNAENILLHGTLGDFCIRCHTPVGMALQEPEGGSNLDRHPTSREGITCVVCHRINQPNSRGSGRTNLVAGGENQVVFGPSGNTVFEEVLADPDKYGVLKTEKNESVRGRDAHSQIHKFFQLGTSGFCGQCHDVLFPLGFRLEDAFSEFKSSPAARKYKLNCQDCHMGKIEGKPSGFFFEPIAKVGNAESPPRRRTSHFFAGPDHSIIHPGLYPHNPDAIREVGEDETHGLATMAEWIQFDWRKNWGSSKFERNKPKDYQFPTAWEDPVRREKARKILNQQFRLLTVYKKKRIEVLQNGFGLSDVQGMHADEKGLHFKVNVVNLTTGHGAPTGFDGERPIYLQVVVWDRDQKVVFRSGDLDGNGDYRDDHSFFVHNGKVPRDRQLFSLQSKFITRNIRGGEREQILPIPYSLNPLNFDRPALRPFTPLGRPLGARKHKQILEPLGNRWAKYRVPACNLTGNGPYYINVRLMAGMIPINLVKTIEFTGFDYGMNAREVADAIVRGQVIVRETGAVFNCHE